MELKLLRDFSSQTIYLYYIMHPTKKGVHQKLIQEKYRF